MKINRIVRLSCLFLILTLLLTSCELFTRTKPPQSETPAVPSQPSTVTTEPITSEPPPVASDPTPDELLADLVQYDFEGTAITVAVPDDCSLFAQGTDSNAVLATVLEAIEKKYNGTIAFGEYTKNHLYLGVEEMVSKGATAYFADMLILPATEYARYREAGLLERLETIPFLDTDADCFDASLTALFADESGTYGVVGNGSQLFKNQIVVYFNPELLAAAQIDFDGYAMVRDKTWDVEALTALITAYAEETGASPIVSDLSEDMTADLLAVLAETDEELGFTVQTYGQDGRNAFLMGRAPILIGVLGDVEIMPTARDLYGMLPLPYTEEGEYETFYDMEGVYVFCVPKGNDRTDCTGLFWQAYHTASEYLPYSYFCQLLLEKYVRDEGTLHMITLVGKEANYLPNRAEDTEE